MAKTVLKVENVSKLYRLGEIGTGTLSHDLNRWWHRMRGKEDPYQQIGTINQRDQKGDTEYVWALKDINLEVKEGEILGIIGANGAGKSTLLKILSKVTAPTTGRIRGKGKVSALLEVGTGFHPELTARENIYLNGAILGMRRHEVKSQLDEIVDFAGVERYLDTPIKRFSSGMKVRLGFAVAAHLNTDILIVDEVLAVGDAEFQQKCIGKIGDISKGEGKTVLFVSHNMESIKKLCKTSIFIKKGYLINKGLTNEVIRQYTIQRQKIIKSTYNFPQNQNKDEKINSINICNIDGVPQSTISLGEDWIIKIEVESKFRLSKTFLSIIFYSSSGASIVTAKSIDDNYYFEVLEGKSLIQVKYQNLYLIPGIYYIDFWWMKHLDVKINHISQIPFQIVNKSQKIKYTGKHGYLKYSPTWNLKKINS